MDEPLPQLARPPGDEMPYSLDGDTMNRLPPEARPAILLEDLPTGIVWACRHYRDVMTLLNEVLTQARGERRNRSLFG